MLHQGLELDLERRVTREASRLTPTRLTPEAVSWEGGPDRTMFWIPEELAPLWGTSAYQSLREDQRLSHNHHYALQVAEQFIWLESNLIIAPLKGLLRGPVPTPALGALLDSFVADELEHSASFQRLLQEASPDFYGKRKFYFFLAPLKVRLLAGLMARLPRMLAGWTLLVGALEETTLAISQRYKQAGASVDALFASVFTLHALDEARHCRLDSMIAEWLIGGQRGWPERINSKVLEAAFRAYFDVGWGYDTLIGQLVAEFPDLGQRRAELVGQATEARSGAYTDRLFHPSVAPITSRNAERYEMLAGAIRRLEETRKP